MKKPKRNKRLLMSFLAINTLVTAYTGTGQSLATTKNDRLYNNIVKNIQTGKTNKNNYKLIENILKKKNRELKDLYLQGDYIVKPEYLEWQIFFSGFYAHRESGDNTLANGTYHSDPSNVNGKFYTALAEAKHVDLGLYIPERTIKRSPVELRSSNLLSSIKSYLSSFKSILWFSLSIFLFIYIS